MPITDRDLNANNMTQSFNEVLAEQKAQKARLARISEVAQQLFPTMVAEIYKQAPNAQIKILAQVATERAVTAATVFVDMQINS